MNRSESKYFHTAEKMDEAFFALLEKKDFEYITIKEICQYAGVNRSTFYLHYQNLNDLLEESVQSMNRKFYAYFGAAGKDHAGEGFLTEKYLVPYLTFIRDHRRLFGTAMRRASTLRLEAQYSQLYREVLEPEMVRLGVPAEQREYLVAFFLHGVLAMIARWMENDCKEPVEFLVQLILHCSTPPGTSGEQGEKSIPAHP